MKQYHQISPYIRLGSLSLSSNVNNICTFLSRSIVSMYKYVLTFHQKEKIGNFYRIRSIFPLATFIFTRRCYVVTSCDLSSWRKCSINFLTKEQRSVMFTILAVYEYGNHLFTLADSWMCSECILQPNLHVIVK